MEPRKFGVAIEVWKDGKGPPRQFGTVLENMTYVDYARGYSDELTIKVCDRDHRWRQDWALKKEDGIIASIVKSEAGKAEKFLDCGYFFVDDVTFSGRPTTAEYKGQSAPVGSNWKSKKRERSWSSATLKQIATDISGEYNVWVVYDGEEITIPHVEQEKETDSSFLSGLAEKYGFVLKVYSQKLVLYQNKLYDAKNAVATLQESDLEPGWTWNTSLVESYTGAHYSYTKSETGETYEFDIGSPERVLEVNEAADSIQEARQITIEKLNTANRGTTSMSCTLKTPQRIVATSNVEIKGFGVMDGKYSVSKVTHTIGSGYTMSLELEKINARIEG